MGKFKFGTEVRDKENGFKGVIDGFAHYATGKDQYLVKNQNYSRWIDVDRTEET